MAGPSTLSTVSQKWVRGPAGGAAPAPTAPVPTVAGTATPRPSVPVERTPPDQDHQVAWIATHGGAGASTLARILGGADISGRWPDPSQGEPGRVLLVARTHHSGMRAVSHALNALRNEQHPAGVRLLAVVLVADAPGRLPRPLGRRVRVIRSASEVHRVPWVPAWRLGEEADSLPREVRALARLVSAESESARETR